MSDAVEPVVRARIVAGALAGVAVALMAAGALAPGFAVLAAAAAAALLVTERGVADRLPADAVVPHAAALAALTGRLGAVAKGVIIPGRTDDEPSRLFVGVADTPLEALPEVTETEALQRARPDGMGVLIPPPGAGLEAAWRADGGLPKGLGAEEAAAHVRDAFGALGLGRGVRTSRSADAVRVTYQPTTFAEACRASREEQAPWDVQGACPACSFAGLLVARAYRSPVRIESSGVAQGSVFVTFRVLRGAAGASVERKVVATGEPGDAAGDASDEVAGGAAEQNEPADEASEVVPRSQA